MRITLGYCCRIVKPWDMCVCSVLQHKVQKIIEDCRLCVVHPFLHCHRIMGDAVGRQLLHSEMVEYLRVERDRKSAVLDVAVCCHDQHSGILFIGWRTARVNAMYKTMVMAVATSLALPSTKSKHVVFFKKKLCVAGVATARGEACILDEPGRLHVTGNAGRSSLKELHVIFQLEGHGIVLYAEDNVDEYGAAPEHCREGVAETAEQNNLA